MEPDTAWSPEGGLGDSTVINKSVRALEAYEFMESLFEVLVGHGVDDGVDEGVEIAQPREEVKNGLVEPAGCADRDDQGDDEEGQPTHDERAQNDPQGLGGFALPSGHEFLLLQQGVGDAHFDLVHVHRRPGFAGYLRSPRVNRGDRRRGPGGVGNQLGSGQTLTGSVGSLFQNPGAGFHVDAAIEGDEEQGGEVESAHRGVDCVQDVVGVHHAVRHRLSFGLPPEEGRQRDADGEDPHQRDHDRGPLGSPFRRVLHGVRNGPVAVQGDDTEVQDGGCATGDVRRQPEVADHLAQRPAAGDRVHGTDGHHQDGHEQVGDRQGGDQVVGRGMQLPRPVHSGDHKGVGERGGQGEERQQQDHDYFPGQGDEVLVNVLLGGAAVVGGTSRKVGLRKPSLGTRGRRLGTLSGHCLHVSPRPWPRSAALGHGAQEDEDRRTAEETAVSSTPGDCPFPGGFLNYASTQVPRSSERSRARLAGWPVPRTSSARGVAAASLAAPG